MPPGWANVVPDDAVWVKDGPSLTVRGNRVLVLPEDQSVTEHASGLVLVESYAPSVLGTVVACGDVQEVKLDDVVVFTKEAGEEFDYEGQRYLIIPEDELIAVLE